MASTVIAARWPGLTRPSCASATSTSACSEAQSATVTIEPRAIEPPILMGATISPTSAAFSVTMPSKGERMNASSRWLSRTLTRAAADRWRASAEADGGSGSGRLSLDDGDLLFRLELALLRPGDLGVHAEHFRAAVLDFGLSRRPNWPRVFRRVPNGVGRPPAGSRTACSPRPASAGAFGGGEFGIGLVGQPGQTLDFRRGLGHFRYGLGDRGVQFAMVQLRDNVALLDELRLGHVQLGEPSGELGGQHRLPVGHHIAGRGEFGAALRRFARPRKP